MITIGLTGSIATGKSTAAVMLRWLGVPVFDADACVHQLMQSSCFNAIAATFPQAVKGKQIDRRALGEIIFADDAQRQRLESLLHPAVRHAEIVFIKRNIAQHRPIIALDIPLLFETDADYLCDSVWVVHCPEFLLRQRALARTGMTEEKLQQIMARQLPQPDKLLLADEAITSGLGKGVMMRQIKQALGDIR